MLLTLGLVATLLTGLDTHESLRACIMDYCQTPSELLEALRRGFIFCNKCIPVLESHHEGPAVMQIATQLTPFRATGDRIVFLSYTWSDAESVLAVDQWLRNKGLVTRIDDRDFFAGNLIEEEIMRVMEQCSVIVIFYSAASKDRPYPKMERELASRYRGKRRVKAIYFCLDDIDFPNEFEAAHLAVRARGKSLESACQQLLRGILDLSKPPQDIDLSRYEQKAPWD